MDVIENLDYVSNIYDIMGICCLFVIKKMENSADSLRDFDVNPVKGKKERAKDLVRVYLADKKLDEDNAIPNLVKGIKNFLYPETDVEKCYHIVKAIDELILPNSPLSNENKGCLRDNNTRQYKSLNKQFKDNIRIIPSSNDSFLNRGNALYLERKTELLNFLKGNSDNTKNSPKDLLRDRRTNNCSDIDFEFIHYNYLDNGFINKYEYEIHELDVADSKYSSFYYRNKVKIGLVPFSSVSLNEILDIHFNPGSFFVSGMKEEQEKVLKKRYCEAIMTCSDQDMDFLVFPEMLLTDQIIDTPCQSENNPRILVNGSIWKNSSNRSVVKNSNHENLFTYFKKKPYIHKKEGKRYVEKLNRSLNKTYHILEIPTYGRVGIGICADLLSEDFLNFQEIMQVNLLIIPACSNSSDLLSKAEYLAGDYHCIVVILNTCAVFTRDNENTVPEKEVAYVVMPSKDGNSRGHLRINFDNCQCQNTCKDKCGIKVVTINFERTKDSNGTLSYEYAMETL